MNGRMNRKFWLVFSSLCLLLSLMLGVLAATLSPASASLGQGAVAAAATRTPTSTPTRAPTRTPRPTRTPPVIQLKFPGDGQGVVVNIVDPNYAAAGMRAMAFQVLVRGVDPEAQDVKANSVEFAVYAIEDEVTIESWEQFEEFRFERTPVYLHTERNSPFCIFRDSNDRCNRLNVRRGARWPQSDDDSIEQTSLRAGSYVLHVRVLAGEDDAFFWQGLIDFKLRSPR